MKDKQEINMEMRRKRGGDWGCGALKRWGEAMWQCHDYRGLFGEGSVLNMKGGEM